jgi:hypothetical protein
MGCGASKSPEVGIEGDNKNGPSTQNQNNGNGTHQNGNDRCGGLGTSDIQTFLRKAQNVTFGHNNDIQKTANLSPRRLFVVKHNGTTKKIKIKEDAQVGDLFTEVRRRFFEPEEYENSESPPDLVKHEPPTFKAKHRRDGFKFHIVYESDGERFVLDYRDWETSMTELPQGLLIEGMY